eukprot:1159188-Pelagomonas_calceolata.AAC.2
MNPRIEKDPCSAANAHKQHPRLLSQHHKLINCNTRDLNEALPQFLPTAQPRHQLHNSGWKNYCARSFLGSNNCICLCQSHCMEVKMRAPAQYLAALPERVLQDLRSLTAGVSC